MSRVNIVLQGGRHDGTEMSIREGMISLQLTTIGIGDALVRSQGWSKDGIPAMVQEEAYFCTGRVVDGREVYASVDNVYSG